MQIKREFPRRRAVNQIWNGAQAYAFAPAFIALGAAGKPDLYLNTLVGLVHKWYDMDQLKILFTDLQTSALRDTFMTLVWLGLEHAVYGKEVPQRPALKDLRLEHAETFCAGAGQAGKVWLHTSTGVAQDMETARWQAVLGEKTVFLNPWEKRLYEALAFDPAWSTAELCTQVREMLRRFFILKYTEDKRGWMHFATSERWAALVQKIFPHFNLQGEDQVLLRPASEAPAYLDGRLSQGLWGQLFNPRREQKDRAYLAQCFGKAFYNPARTAELEHALCTGNHKDCHLYFSSGEKATVKGELPYVAVAAERQREANLAYYKEHESLYRHLSRQLERQIKNALLVTQQPLPVRARTGNFMPGQVWRALALHDGQVFEAKEESMRPDFTVDMLLDASGSRIYTQEIIAAQAYALAVSLSRCGISLQIYSFCSLRGYTVLRLLKKYQDRQHLENLFSYFATGWNRDGLALRGAAHLLSSTEGKKLLIMLTDAHPNDDLELPQAGLRQHRAYGEAAAVADTAAEVQTLRNSGIRVIGLISGEDDDNTTTARAIFGQDFVRVTEIAKMAVQVGRLLQRQIAAL